MGIIEKQPIDYTQHPRVNSDDPVPPRPAEVPTPDQPIEDPAPNPMPEIPPDPGHDPRPREV